MNVKPYNTTDYENKSNWTLGENKPNSKPIKPNTKPKQTQYKANTKPKQSQTKPIQKRQNEHILLYHKGL